MPRWLERRLFSVIATVVLVVIGIVSTIWIGPDIVGSSRWAIPDDLFGTLIAADRMLHLHLGGLYTQPTGLISLPGTPLILVPVVAVLDLAGTPIGFQGPQNPRPASWPLAGSYEIAISCLVLFAADALARRLGLSKGRRAVLTTAETIAVWNVSIRWGHPEDAVAVALFLYGILALSDARARRAAWLIGCGIAVQPLVLLALPVVLAVVERHRIMGFVLRAAAPSSVLLALAAAANWSATFVAVTKQPNQPGTDHPTPFTALAPHLGTGTVAAGPARAVTVVLALACAVVVGRRWRSAATGKVFGRAVLEDVVWWTAVALMLRCVFEPVMVAFYLWPVLAVALVAAATGWRRLLTTAVAATAVTFVSQANWRGAWLWWGTMTASLLVTLALARRRQSLAEDPPPGSAVFSVASAQGSQETWPTRST